MSKIVQFYGSCKGVAVKPLETYRTFHIFVTYAYPLQRYNFFC